MRIHSFCFNQSIILNYYFEYLKNSFDILTFCIFVDNLSHFLIIIVNLIFNFSFLYIIFFHFTGQIMKIRDYGCFCLCL